MLLSYFVLIYDKGRHFFLHTKLIGYLFSIFEYFICFFIAIREIIPTTPYYIYKQQTNFKITLSNGEKKWDRRDLYWLD